ncbi:MAG TPA: radical SAM protein [Firmicutes bacterium]|nr:radical SAM protein [Bacillota bacterium]
MPGSLSPCFLCPRECGAHRSEGEKGICGGGDRIKVARLALHVWEEPCISGTRGSGTVFFSGCNLRCVYCQNAKISWEGFGTEMTPAELAAGMLRLEEAGAHNINLVTAAPYVPLVVEALDIARTQGLRLPVVYNTSAYEKVETLRLLLGCVDVYLPDLKYASEETARRLSGAPDYFTVATAAIQEMLHQVGGEPVFDSEGLMQRGLIVRHLVLPGHLPETYQVLAWIKDHLPRSVPLSLMAQYLPYHLARRFPPLNRRLTEDEYNLAVAAFFDLGLENGWAQELSAADGDFIPPFDLTGCAGKTSSSGE